MQMALHLALGLRHHVAGEVGHGDGDHGSFGSGLGTPDARTEGLAIEFDFGGDGLKWAQRRVPSTNQH